jgi:hypothetical protein
VDCRAYRRTAVPHGQYNNRRGIETEARISNELGGTDTGPVTKDTNLKNTKSTPPTGDLSVIFKPAYDATQRRRKLSAYYKAFTTSRLTKAVLTPSHLTQAVHSASPVATEQEVSRIGQLLFAQIDSFNGPETKQAMRLGFHKWATEWVSRYSRLLEVSTPLVPALTRLAESIPGLFPEDYPRVVARVLDCLHQYPGIVTDLGHFTEWISEQTLYHVRATIELVVWIEVHSGAAYDGIWSVLAGLRDLGADESTADELSCDLWSYVAAHATSFVDSDVPLKSRFRALGVEFAHNWKASRLYSRGKFRGIAAVETGQIQALDKAAGVPSVRKRPVTPAEPAKVA